MLDRKAVIPTVDLPHPADKTNPVQRHDLLALRDAGAGKTVAVQAHMGGLRHHAALRRERDHGEDGAGRIGIIVTDDDHRTSSVLDMAGDDRQVCHPDIHVSNGRDDGSVGRVRSVFHVLCFLPI